MGFKNLSLKQLIKNADGKYKSSQDYTHDFYITISEVKNALNDNVAVNLGFWCFNPGFLFSEIQNTKVRSIILTSGTLSPMSSFAMELQTVFNVTLENEHVVNSNQV